MKIDIKSVEVVDSKLVITFEEDILNVYAHAQAEFNSIGRRAMRILYMHAGKVPFACTAKQPRQIVLDHRHAPRSFSTTSKLQAAMDQHAKTRLQVTGFKRPFVEAGNENTVKVAANEADLAKTLRLHPDYTVRIIQDVRLNMPVMPRDAICMGRVLGDLHCSRWDTMPELELDILRLTMYMEGIYKGLNPWTFMKALEQKIRTEIAAE